MLKKRIIAVLAGLALLAAVAGSSGIVGDAFGLDGTSPAYACNNGSSSGGC
ncbi:MAG TPA: hypothetical protein PKD98_10250 [Anaerolineae bacterium]|nr:hypothetical protein [Anaerolineae bacterium]